MNYHLGNYSKNTIWIIGEGRSGTTWLSDIINWKKNFREMFEPFHPLKVKEAQAFSLHQYVRIKDKSNSDFTYFMDSVFTGKFMHYRVDEVNQNIFYNGLLIKDIFANLIAPWVQERYPNIKIILLIRNPFEVAISKQNKKDWGWMEDPKLFLEQKDLYEDFLQPFEEIIKSVSDDYIERQIMIWAILHYVLFQQIKKNKLHIVFYENLLHDTKQEISNLMQYIYGNDHITVPSELLSITKIPSRVASEKRMNGNLNTNEWRKKLTDKQFNKGLEILSIFKLDSIYNKDFKPHKQEVEKLLQNHSSE